MAKKESADKNNNKSINELIDALNKKFKKEVATTLEDSGSKTKVEKFLSTGSIILDIMCVNKKCGGVPLGRITTLEGTEQTGKSLMAAHICISALREKGTVIYIDREFAVDRGFFRRVGLDDSKIIYADNLEHMEEVLEFIENAIVAHRNIDKNGILLIIWDSLAATPTAKEMEGSYQDQEYASAAKLLSRSCRKLAKTVADNKVALVIVNQLKTKIPRPGERVYGDNLNAFGGHSLLYHASLRIVLRNAGFIKNAQKEIMGVFTEAKVLKSRFGPAQRKCNLNIYYSHGIDDGDAYLNKLKEYDIVKVKSPYFYCEELFGEKGFQTSDWNERLKDPEFKEKVKEMLIKTLVIDYDKVDIGKLTIESSDSDSLMEVEALADEIIEERKS